MSLAPRWSTNFVLHENIAGARRALAVGLALGLALAAWSTGAGAIPAAAAESWPQLKFDARRSGDAADRELPPTLALLAAAPTTDAILTSPVAADGRVYVVDAAGVAFCFDADTLALVWKFASAGGPANCNNVASPAIVGKYLHFGTITGAYYVLDRATGAEAARLECGDPIFSAPAVVGERAYFHTLGGVARAVSADGQALWKWDFVREVIGFPGDRWNGADWLKHKGGRVTWKDHFCASRDIGALGDMVVMPAGGRTVFLRDAGDRAELLAVGQIPSYSGREYPACFGQSLGPDGEVYVQWHRRDNAGRVEILKLTDEKDEQGRFKVAAGFVPGTLTDIHLPGHLSFASVSMRGRSVYRCRPEQGFGFCRHSLDGPADALAQLDSHTGAEHLGGYPSICAPILTRAHGVFGGLDGKLHVAPLAPGGPTRSFATPWGKAISAPPAVCDGKVYFTCEDGHLYLLGDPGGAAAARFAEARFSAERLAAARLPLETIRSPLSGKHADAKYDWYTNYGDLSGVNANQQELRPPLKMKWIRRYEGTFKHLPVCGGGRMYTHTSEGQVFAVEQETGRLLWRRYWPGVHLSFTSPIYFRRGDQERLLLPQAGLAGSRVRCLDAATGDPLWEAPFTGSPSWSRQAPPVLHGDLAIYASGSGQYAPQGVDKAFIMKGEPRTPGDGDETMSWIYTHDNPYYPRDNKPLIWAWNLDTGREVWRRDFSEHGAGGNDCGLCLLDGKLYYSTFFGYSADKRRRRGLPPGPNGITARLNPADGRTEWLATEHHVTAGCTISGKDGRLYLGGYNAPDESDKNRYVFCLSAADGKLVWRSDPVASAVNVITVTDDFVFSNASGRDGHVFDKATGKILSRFNFGYACTRFTCSGSYVLGANMDLIDLSRGNTLVSTGPCVDSRECVGGVVSNGRLFYTSQASGLQTCQTPASEADVTVAPWDQP